MILHTDILELKEKSRKCFKLIRNGQNISAKTTLDILYVQVVYCTPEWNPKKNKDRKTGAFKL